MHSPRPRRGPRSTSPTRLRRAPDPSPRATPPPHSPWHPRRRHPPRRTLRTLRAIDPAIRVAPARSGGGHWALRACASLEYSILRGAEFRVHPQSHLTIPPCGIGDGVTFGRDVDSETSDHFERVRVEVEPKVVSSSFTIVHIGHKKSSLAHFGEARHAFRSADSRLTASLQVPHPRATDAQEPRRWKRIEPYVEMQLPKAANPWPDCWPRTRNRMRPAGHLQISRSSHPPDSLVQVSPKSKLISGA